MHYSIFLQITPAHDPNDFEVGKRHKLEFINIFTDDGNINSNGGPDFAGMPRFKARVAVTKALEEKVLLPNLSPACCSSLECLILWPTYIHLS